jgi:FK506-binding protein 1
VRLVQNSESLYDIAVADARLRFDSSDGRGALKVKIGTGRVIRGWDEGIVGNASISGMSLGEKSTLVISR